MSCTVPYTRLCGRPGVYSIRHVQHVADVNVVRTNEALVRIGLPTALSLFIVKCCTLHRQKDSTQNKESAGSTLPLAIPARPYVEKCRRSLDWVSKRTKCYPLYKIAANGVWNNETHTKETGPTPS